MTISRRNLLIGAGGIIGATTVDAAPPKPPTAPQLKEAPSEGPSGNSRKLSPRATESGSRTFNSSYRGDHLSQIAFPMGGMGAGMICLEGTGALSRFSLRNRPDLTSEPIVFSAVSIKGPQKIARVLEGPVPTFKLRPQFPVGEWDDPPFHTWGLPRFRGATFKTQFPFATVELKDDEMPLEVGLTGWSPFSPGDSDNASLPVVGLEYRFLNRGEAPIDAVFSFNTENFMAEPPDPLDPSDSIGPPDPFAPKVKPLDRIRSTLGGFILYGPGAKDHPWDEASFAAWIDDPNAKVNHAWFRGGWNDSLQMAWNDIESGASYTRDPLAEDSSAGASIFVPFALAPGQTKTLILKFAWYAPKSNLFEPKFAIQDGKPVDLAFSAETYRSWYAGRFPNIEQVIRYWQDHYQTLRLGTVTFTHAFYDSTLPPEAIEAVAANLSILKSPTVLRQTDGRLWAWEGCEEAVGSSYGFNSEVWTFGQAVAHLFPDIERGIRETQLGPSQNEEGYQVNRVRLPIHSIGDTEAAMPFTAGPFYVTIAFYRDWRICGDTAWLRRWWPRIRASLDYCIKTWDPDHRGWPDEPIATDMEDWGPNGFHTSLYLGALKAACLMGQTLNESVYIYSELFDKGVRRMEEELFDGEYFIQKIGWTNLRTPFPPTKGDLADIYRKYPEALKLGLIEGPPYQSGKGCDSGGVLGAWLCLVCGIGDLLDPRKVESHLTAVYSYNLKKHLTDNVNVHRTFFACGDESGLLLCTWPKGGKPSLPNPYAAEVWTGIEYQVASHLIALGNIDKGLDIVRACRSRYDGRVRNPFDEVEAGHWYTRAMSSYALLQAFSGARFDAVDKILYLNPVIKGDFRCFLSTATGYGTVGVKYGQPFVEVVSGHIPYSKIMYTPAT